MSRYTDRTVRNVLNVLLESGLYPSQWTKGYAIPIFKKGAKDDDVIIIVELLLLVVLVSFSQQF